MPSSKKKREHSAVNASQTLLNFFTPRPVGSSATREIKAKPIRNSKSSSSKQIAGCTFQQEIIVIDSDGDDNGVELIESAIVKRRKLSPRNTDVDVSVKTEDPSCNVDLDFSGKVPDESRVNSSLDATQRLARSLHHITDTKPHEVVSFGQPLLLVTQKPEDHSVSKQLEPFGRPFGALGQLSSAVAGDTVPYSVTVASSSKGHPNSKIEDTSVDLDLTLEDWGDGDDENNAENSADESSDVEVSEISSCKPLKDGNCDANFGTEVRTSSLTDDWSTIRPEIRIATPTSKLLTNLSSSSSAMNNKRGHGKTKEKLPMNNYDAFSILMTSFKENEIWREASLFERKVPPQQKSRGPRRKAPFYKVLTGMPIAVDAFKYGAINGVTAYFLTHAHSDHYTNLSSSWKHGPIYCSQGTANLIIHMLSVDRKWVHPLPMNVPTLVPNTNGVAVTLIEANHCPGSCLFFFEGPQTVNAGDSTFKSPYVGSSRVFRYLHCGDFRASPQHVLHPAVKNKVLDLVYLDTTYLDPKYTFPPQPLVISACAEVARRAIDGQPIADSKSTIFSWMTSVESKGKERERPKALIIVGTYSIGKERIVKAIAHAVNSKVYCDRRKAAILRCQGDKELDDLLTSNPLDAVVHLVPLSTIDSDHMKTYLDRFKGSFNKIIGFRPTGWTYTQASGTDQLPPVSSILAKAASSQEFKHTDLKLSARSTTTLQLYPVPYSEHSSFYELTCFTLSFTWVKMIATVNVGNETSRGKMAKWVARWEAERKKRGQDTIVPYRHPDYW